jgi:glutaredoxin 3
MSEIVVTIYGKDNCHWCKEAKSLAERHSLKYEYKNIGTVENRNEMFELVPDAKTVPQVFWNNRYVGGYNEFASEIENTLGSNFGQELF